MLATTLEGVSFSLGAAGNDLVNVTDGMGVMLLSEQGAVASLSAFEDGEVDGLVNAIMPAVPFPEERNRLSTYTSLLRIADQHERVPAEADFFEEVSAVNSRLSDSLLSCRNGWQRYLIRDGLAVCHEATLAAVISGIEHFPNKIIQSDKSLVGHRRDELIFNFRQL